MNSLTQAWLWCRRNPAIAALTATVAVLLVTISVGSTLTAIRLQRLIEENKQLNRRIEKLKGQHPVDSDGPNEPSGMIPKSAREFDGIVYYTIDKAR